MLCHSFLQFASFLSDAVGLCFSFPISVILLPCWRFSGLCSFVLPVSPGSHRPPAVLYPDFCTFFLPSLVIFLLFSLSSSCLWLKILINNFLLRQRAHLLSSCPLLVLSEQWWTSRGKPLACSFSTVPLQLCESHVSWGGGLLFQHQCPPVALWESVWPRGWNKHRGPHIVQQQGHLAALVNLCLLSSCSQEVKQELVRLHRSFSGWFAASGHDCWGWLSSSLPLRL